MTLAEALLQGVSTTVIGLVIVFAVLAILWGVLVLMRKLFYKEPGKEAAKPAPAEQSAPAVRQETAPVASVSQDTMDEGELIAVLTAAVAASLNTSTYNLHIKSYRRIGNTAPVWNQAGLNDTINSRF